MVVEIQGTAGESAGTGVARHDPRAERAAWVDPRDFTLRDAAGRLFVVTASQAQLIDGLRLNDLRVGVRLQVRGRGAAPLVASWVRIDR